MLCKTRKMSKIFVTVGNATQGFSRLLNAVADLLEGEIFAGDETFVQSGNNPDFQSPYCEYRAFLASEVFAEKIAEADLILSHGGAGTLVHTLQAGKVPVVMPRRSKYGEIIDDHQVELVQALAQAGRIVPAYEPEDLVQAIHDVRQRNLQKPPDSPSLMLGLVARAIDDLMGSKTHHRTS